MRLLAVLCVCVASAAEQYPTPRFTDPGRRTKLEAAFPEIEKIFDKALRDTGTPGMAYGVVIDGEIALVKGLGVADRTSGRAVTPDTVFRIASMTKSFTALCILKLRDDAKLTLDDPVAKWIPELRNWKYPTADSGPIRIRHLLTHGGGFPEDNPWGDRQLAVSDDTMGRWLKAELPFSTPPDTAFEYSNYGYAILGRVIAAAAGMPYAEYVQKTILDPLGMKSSGLEVSRFPPERLAIGYGKDQSEPSLHHGPFGAMGGMHTTARDLGRYVAFLMAAFPPRDGTDDGPVRRASVREMQHPWRPEALTAGRPADDGTPRVRDVAYGYGLGVQRDCEYGTTVSHSGGLPGFGSHMAWLPEYGVGVFSMTNLTYTSGGRAVREAFDALRKTGALKRRELPASAALVAARDAIGRLWERWDQQELERIAADNLFLDASPAVRRSGLNKIKGEVGACRAPGELKPENWLRGSFDIECERGLVRVTFTLAPTTPPKVQYLRFERGQAEGPPRLCH
jgi:CubicO group peptidase (beta-lactamase class C family)